MKQIPRANNEDKMRYWTFIGAIAAFLCGNAMALAAGKIIEQKNKAFSESEVVIKKGETITFVNTDNITHNVMSRSAGNEFNIGAQPPGMSAPVTFDAVGTAEIICAIHPQMRVTIKITG